MTTLRDGFTSDQLEAMVNAGFDLVETGDLDGAAIIFGGLTTLDPFNASFHAALGSVLHQKGEVAAAEKSYDTALSITPTHPLALVNRGELRCQRADLNGIEDLRAAAAKPSPVQGRAQALLARYGG